MRDVSEIWQLLNNWNRSSGHVSRLLRKGGCWKRLAVRHLWHVKRQSVAKSCHGVGRQKEKKRKEKNSWTKKNFDHRLRTQMNDVSNSYSDFFFCPCRFQCVHFPNQVLESLSIIDTPGILSSTKKRLSRGKKLQTFDFIMLPSTCGHMLTTQMDVFVQHLFLKLCRFLPEVQLYAVVTRVIRWAY